MSETRRERAEHEAAQAIGVGSGPNTLAQLARASLADRFTAFAAAEVQRDRQALVTQVQALRHDSEMHLKERGTAWAYDNVLALLAQEPEA